MGYLDPLADITQKGTTLEGSGLACRPSNDLETEGLIFQADFEDNTITLRDLEPQ